MSGKWTPGPWESDSGEVIRIRDMSEATLASVTHTHLAGRRDIAEVEANARLIAASPELAAAVQIGMKDLLTAAHWAPAEYRPAFMATYEQMKNALAKAKGEGA